MQLNSSVYEKYWAIFGLFVVLASAISHLLVVIIDIASILFLIVDMDVFPVFWIIIPYFVCFGMFLV